MSLPTGERGLKPEDVLDMEIRYMVAPHGGAWIETDKLNAVATVTRVAPHGGAWIETGIINQCFISFFSRSPRGSVD